MVKSSSRGRGPTEAASNSSKPHPFEGTSVEQQLEPFWLDGTRYRWKRYQNRYHRSKCCFYPVPCPEEES